MVCCFNWNCFVIKIVFTCKLPYFCSVVISQHELTFKFCSQCKKPFMVNDKISVNPFSYFPYLNICKQFVLSLPFQLDKSYLAFILSSEFIINYSQNFHPVFNINKLIANVDYFAFTYRLNFHID
jgi:hypothetical protein